MDRLWSPVRAAAAADPLQIALSEIDVAIELVRRRQARRVRLVGLIAGEQAAGPGLARAQSVGVRFVLERDAASNGAVSLLIGPALDD